MHDIKLFIVVSVPTELPNEVRMPVDGSVPIGFHGYTRAKSFEAAAKRLGAKLMDGGDPEIQFRVLEKVEGLAYPLYLVMMPPMLTSLRDLQHWNPAIISTTVGEED